MSSNDKSKNANDATGGSTSTGGPTDGSLTSVDFNTMPTSALVSYIDYYGLAPRYPFLPDPAPMNSPSPSASASASASADPPDSEELKRKAEEDLLIEASGKRRAALASAAATSGSYHNGKFRARSPPATTSATTSSGRKRGPAAVDTDAGEDGQDMPPGDFWDDEDAKGYLAKVAREHFEALSAPKEGEVVVGFLYRCRTKDRALKIAQAP